jgi:hypothetical protein
LKSPSERICLYQVPALSVSSAAAIRSLATDLMSASNTVTRTDAQRLYDDKISGKFIFLENMGAKKMKSAQTPPAEDGKGRSTKTRLVSFSESIR